MLTVMVNSGTSEARFSLYPEEYPPASEVVAAAADDVEAAAGVPTNWNPDQTPKNVNYVPINKSYR